MTTPTLRACLGRSLAKNLNYGLAVVAALVALNATATTEQLDSPNVVECWNPHTAQITVEVGTTCPTPVNPYITR
jgi:hypothetical protein